MVEGLVEATRSSYDIYREWLGLSPEKSGGAEKLPLLEELPKHVILPLGLLGSLPKSILTTLEDGKERSQAINWAFGSRAGRVCVGDKNSVTVGLEAAVFSSSFFRQRNPGLVFYHTHPEIDCRSSVDLVGTLLQGSLIDLVVYRQGVELDFGIEAFLWTREAFDFQEKLKKRLDLLSRRERKAEIESLENEIASQFSLESWRSDWRTSKQLRKYGLGFYVWNPLDSRTKEGAVILGEEGLRLRRVGHLSPQERFSDVGSRTLRV